MDAAGLTCAECGAPLPEGSAGSGAPVEQTCPVCGLRQIICLFPALTRRQARASEGARALAGEAACFHHAEHRAESVCDACGRFLCGLCSIDFNGRTLCPACLSLTQAATASDAHIPRRTRYDKLAWLCVLLSPFTYCISFVNACVALFLCFRYWRTPLSVLPRSRWRFVAAGLLAVVLLAFWTGAAVMFLHGIRTARQPKRPAPTEAAQPEASHAP
jgi:hypothetical protein